MDEFGVLTERFGLKPHGKAAPMAVSKRTNNTNTARAFNFDCNSSTKSSSCSSKSGYNSNSFNGSLFDDGDNLFSHLKSQNLGSSDDGFDVLGNFQNNTKQSSNHSTGSSFDYDAIFSNSNRAKPSFHDDIFGGFSSSSSNSINNDDVFGSFASKPKQSAPVDDLFGNFGAKSTTPTRNGSDGFDDLIPGFSSSSAATKGKSVQTTKSTFTSVDDPFVVLESTSNTTKSTFTDPLEEFGKFTSSGSTKPAGSSSVSTPLRPPPRPGQISKANNVKDPEASSLDELEDFAMGRGQSTVNGQSGVHHGREGRERQNEKGSRYKEAEDAKQQTEQKNVDYLDSLFRMGSRSSSVPKSRVTTLDPLFDTNSRGKSSGTGMKKISSTTHMVDDFSSIFGDASLFGEFGEFEEVEGESEERRRARLGRHQRTQNRMAQAVADMNQRDLQTQNEQEERHRIADQIDVQIKHWAAGKECNMRALLSSMQYVLRPECGWEAVSLTDLITSTSVKKVYRKATLCVHPDKVQQKGATLEQKYIAEKVFDILKEAWNKFNKEELS